MTLFGFRQNAKRFIDTKNYPRGFRKSGDFSIAESEIISSLGVSLLSLTDGTIEPETEEESRLLDVLNGKETPVSNVEKAWSKYIRLTRNPRRFYTLNGSQAASSLKEEDEDTASLEYEIDD